ncbi:MAG: dihydroxy-acid dehydratase [Syntrophorhabdales bacterium]|jgi:dihydroxy-acid dehydratase
MKGLKTARYFHGVEGTHRRAAYKGMGFTDDDMKKPLVAVVNTPGEVCPGHFHLRMVADAVKAGVWQAGGTPMEFTSISQCATPSLGLASMRYDLPARDLLAFDIETIVETQIFDAVVAIVTCDKTIPGALMAAARLDMPFIVVPGGIMAVGSHQGRPVSLADLDEKVWGAYQMGRVTPDEVLCLEDEVCPGPGACPILGTANTMQCLVEAAGMAMPGSGTCYAMSGEQLRLAKLAGNRVMKLIDAGMTARRIMTREALENMVRTQMTIGGSTNAVLHILAIAQELGLGGEIDLELIDRFSNTTPCLVDVTPTGYYHLPDLHRAGGVPKILEALEKELHVDAVTVTGKTIGGLIEEARKRPVVDELHVIRSRDNPVAETGGIAILRGNLAPLGSVARRLNNTIPEHKGPAKCFDCQEDAIAAIDGGKVAEGDVVVVRYAGPRGAPGMPDIYAVLASVVGRGLEGKVAVVTDGRFSGFARGLGVCQISPEAAVGGPLAAIRDGDRIHISMPRRELSLLVDDLEGRLRAWRRPAPRETRGMLALYATNAQPAWKGARLAMYEEGQ